MNATLFTAGVIGVIALANTPAFAGSERSLLCEAGANFVLEIGRAAEARIPLNAALSSDLALFRVLDDLGVEDSAEVDREYAAIAMVAYGSAVLGESPILMAADFFDGCMSDDL